MRLIDANELTETIRHFVDTMSVCTSTDYCNGLRFMKKQAIEDVENAPTIDAVEVIYGEWISDYDGFEWSVRCSVCGEEALIKEGGSHDHAYSNYCPKCGARMQKGE